MSEFRKSKQKSRGPWTITQPHVENSNTKFFREEARQSFDRRATKSNQKTAQKQDCESSSEEDVSDSENIINFILKNYTSTGVDLNNITRTKGYLEDAFVSSAATCLICISHIKRNDSIWNCEECYSSFHLMCIQRWSKDSVFNLKQASEEHMHVKKIKIGWCCPKCRHEYEPEDIPSEYRCFCKKAVDPAYQYLLMPHSCGFTCRKELKPYCGHECVLLCHPGPCPPCPKVINVTCHCGGKPAMPQRCCNREWSCGGPCNKLLSCGKHKCAQVCHAGDCQPCPKKSIQKCLCGSSQRLRDCASPVWQCEKPCNKPLDCGHHRCNKICHPSAECGTCELSLLRKCPCGKSSYQLPCTEEDTPTCDDTCGKTLECGQHVCQQKCHRDRCGICVEIVEKLCRCGLHSKQVQCWKPYLCETKCKQMKDCNKHPCNRKCCDGNCPPCEKPCGKTLSCNNHKCASICHRGLCYPCQLTEKVFCRCGETFLTVPCGRKHKTKPPRCLKNCSNPPDCHHDKRDDHRCHFGDCPPCRQICRKMLDGCTHSCPARCHENVLVQIEAKKATMPWEQTAPQMEKQALPCPECVVPMPVTCLGEHEVADFPCHLAKPASCGRVCGRKLKCGNHVCLKECHIVENDPGSNYAGDNCDNCNEQCSNPQPEGCNHQCPLPCHPGDCPPCKQIIRIKCHCGLNQPYVPCKEWTGPGNKELLQSCGNRCPKNYDCGHRCRSNCHSGACADSETCKKRVKVTCPCKRIKKELPCESIKRGDGVNCDETCEEKKREEEKIKQMELEQKLKEEKLKNQKELEKYEKMFHGKKKNRERRIREGKEEQNGFFSRNYPVIFALLGVLCATVVFFYVNL